MRDRLRPDILIFLTAVARNLPQSAADRCCHSPLIILSPTLQNILSPQHRRAVYRVVEYFYIKEAYLDSVVPLCSDNIHVVHLRFMGFSQLLTYCDTTAMILE